MTLLAAFQVLLARLSGQEDIPVGSPTAGRTRAEVEGLIGVFINNLVLRTDLSGNPTFRELLRRVRTVSLDAYAHQDLPFEKVVEDLQPERSLGHSPLFQVMFNMLSFGLAQVDLPGLEVEFSVTLETGANFDLTLYCVERENKLELLWEYDADLFEAATIDRWMGHWQKLLEAVVVNPDLPITDLPILTEAERGRLVFDWNDTTLAYPAETIQALFEDQGDAHARRRGCYWPVVAAAELAQIRSDALPLERAERLELLLVYNADLFEHGRMLEVLHQYEWLIQQIVEQPDRPIRALSLVTPTVKTVLPDPTQVLSEPAYPSVPAKFAEWLARQPDHAAVRQGDRSWTYAQLAADARALVGTFPGARRSTRPGCRRNWSAQLRTYHSDVGCPDERQRLTHARSETARCPPAVDA